MPHLLAVTCSRQQRKHALSLHPHISGAALADFHIGRVTGFAVKSCIGKDDHSPFKGFQQRVKFRLRDVSCRCLPAHHRSPFIQHHTKFASNNPARIRLAFLADALRLQKAHLAHWVTKLNTKQVSDTQYGGFGQKKRRPVLVGVEQMSQATAFRQVGKQRQIIALDSAIERSGRCAFQGKQQSAGDDLGGIEFGL